MRQPDDQATPDHGSTRIENVVMMLLSMVEDPEAAAGAVVPHQRVAYMRAGAMTPSFSGFKGVQ